MYKQQIKKVAFHLTGVLSIYLAISIVQLQAESGCAFLSCIVTLPLSLILIPIAVFYLYSLVTKTKKFDVLLKIYAIETGIVCTVIVIGVLFLIGLLYINSTHRDVAYLISATDKNETGNTHYQYYIENNIVKRTKKISRDTETNVRKLYLVYRSQYTKFKYKDISEHFNDENHEGYYIQKSKNCQQESLVNEGDSLFNKIFIIKTYIGEFPDMEILACTEY